MNLFQNSYSTRPKKNAFNLSHEKKLSCNMAELVPFYLEEIIPGDRFSVNSEILMRLAPLVSPIMHRVNVYTHYFFVPNRIVWDNWQSFITGGEDGADASVAPMLRIGDATKEFFVKGKLPDYFGVPVTDGTTVAQGVDVSAIPFRAYAEIFNEYYRDQNLQDKIEFSKTDDLSTGDTERLTQIRTRNWEKDYFTSALPWAQKGNPVTAPIQMAYVQPPGQVAFTYPGGNPTGVGSIDTNLDGVLNHETDGAMTLENIDPDSTGIDIEELRISVKLQRWLERNARSGSRYIESIMAHFGERVPDYTAQRPVYLGGGKNPVVISEVLQTSATNTQDTAVDASVQGNMAGHGIVTGRSNKFKSKFTEHGYVIGIMSTLPRTAYQQGLERTWSKKSKFDYFWPEFAQLGEQEVLNKEIYADFLNDNDLMESTFGYQSRYAEYKYKQSLVAGDFRDNLAFWHMGRKFTDLPTLSEEFIQADPRHDVFAVEDADTDKLYVQIYNNIKALRPIPLHNIPTL